MDKATFTREDFQNGAQWRAFKQYTMRKFVKAQSAPYNEAVEEFAEDHITFKETEDYRIENALEDIKDLAKEENENPIRDARERLGLSRKEAAELVGVPLRTWEKWERGERQPAEYLERLVVFYLENKK